jgi:hypothetical protein
MRRVARGPDVQEVDRVMRDDGDVARLTQIERQLAQEDPELAEALHRWRQPDHAVPGAAAPRRWSRFALVTGLVLAALALLLGSGAWFLLAVVTAGTGWCLTRAGEDAPRLPRPERGG